MPLLKNGKDKMFSHLGLRGSALIGWESGYAPNPIIRRTNFAYLKNCFKNGLNRRRDSAYFSFAVSLVTQLRTCFLILGKLRKGDSLHFLRILL